MKNSECMKESRLYKALCEFKGAEGDEDSLLGKFEDIAKAAFYTGHFVVNNEYRIYITDLEFYYHEDKGTIKDKVKYHRNYENDELPYFPIGSLHPHKSGVDVTFENPNSPEQFRASFLIRGYEERGNDYNFAFKNEIKNQTKPTYLLDDLFGGALFLSVESMSIKWIDEDDKTVSEQKQPSRKKRVNVNSDREWRFIKQY